MARKDADEQLSFWIDDSNLRAWLLMNMMADSDTGKIRWRCNVQGIFDSFNSHLGTLFFQLELLIFWEDPQFYFGKPEMFISKHNLQLKKCS